MDDVYAKISNYNEINLENRIERANIELTKWGDQSEIFTKYRQEWKRASEDDKFLPEKPLHVDIELSDACNLKCPFCTHGIDSPKNVGFMDQVLAKKIIKECADAGVYSIKLNWRGETSINPFLDEAVKYAKDLGILEVQITTNGFPKDKMMYIKCIENGVDRLIFSIDGFSKETFETARAGGKYEKILENIQQVLDYKKEHSLTKPFIRLQFVRTNLNRHEVDDFINFWQDKVDDVRISDVMNRGQGNQMSVGEQVTTGRKRCPQPFQRLTIGRNGKVVPCCADWDQKYIVGDCNEESLLDIWNGKRMGKMRKIQNDVQLDKIEVCQGCFVKESYTWEKK